MCIFTQVSLLTIIRRSNTNNPSIPAHSPKSTTQTIDPPRSVHKTFKFRYLRYRIPYSFHCVIFRINVLSELLLEANINKYLFVPHLNSTLIRFSGLICDHIYFFGIVTSSGGFKSIVEFIKTLCRAKKSLVECYLNCLIKKKEKITRLLFLETLICDKRSCSMSSISTFSIYLTKQKMLFQFDCLNTLGLQAIGFLISFWEFLVRE